MLKPVESVYEVNAKMISDLIGTDKIPPRATSVPMAKEIADIINVPAFIAILL